LSRTAFEIRADDDGVLFLSGELDLGEAAVFPDAAAAHLNGGGDVVLDCSGLTFLDSSGIRAIFQFASRAGRPVALRNPPGNVEKVLRIAGVDGQMGLRIETR
jgi:anti-anti-sigma factor